MIKAGSLILLFMLTFFGYAQENSIDSLEVLLKEAQSDTVRIKYLCTLSDKYLAYQPAKAKAYAKEALELSRSLNYLSGEILALNRLGEHEFRRGNYARAVELTSHSLLLADQINDSTAMAMAYRVLGNINTFGLKRYDLAEDYQMKAYAIYKARKDKEKIASFCGSITWIYAMTQKKLEEAHRLADLGIHLSDSLHSNQFLSYNLNSKGLIYMQQNELDSALKYIDLSINVGNQAKDKSVIAYNKYIQGEIYLKKGEPEKAIATFSAAIDECKKLNLREILKDSYEGLSRSYVSLDNYLSAYNYHLLYSHLKDSLLAWENTQMALMGELEFEKAKQEAKIVELEQANLQASREKFIYGILYVSGFIFLTTVILLVVRINRQRTKTNNLLEEKNGEIAKQNRELKQANDTKDKLFSIIGHDLRSPLISLKGLLTMVIEGQVTDNEFKAFAPKLNQNVTGINETLDNLLQWAKSQMKGWHTQPSVFVLADTISKSINLFTTTAREKKIKLKNEVDPTIKIFGDQNQIELIFRNLIHNAIKFTPELGCVCIKAVRDNSFIKISVIDTGLGMTKEQVDSLFQEYNPYTTRGTSGEKGTGLGLHLCKEMVECNEGKIHAESEEKKGSTFYVYLKSAPTN